MYKLSLQNLLLCLIEYSTPTYDGLRILYKMSTHVTYKHESLLFRCIKIYKITSVHFQEFFDVLDTFITYVKFLYLRELLSISFSSLIRSLH